MEINLEKKVGFQKLRQDEIEFLQVQKRENSRIMIFVVMMFCLTIIGKLAHHHQASTGPGRLGRPSWGFDNQGDEYFDQGFDVLFKEFWQQYFTWIKKKLLLRIHPRQ